MNANTAATPSAKPRAYGDAVTAPYVMPRADNPREFRSEPRDAVIVGLSHSNGSGDAFVKFDDGTLAWVALNAVTKAIP